MDLKIAWHRTSGTSRPQGSPEAGLLLCVIHNRTAFPTRSQYTPKVWTDLRVWHRDTPEDDQTLVPVYQVHMQHAVAPA